MQKGESIILGIYLLIIIFVCCASIDADVSPIMGVAAGYNFEDMGQLVSEDYEMSFSHKDSLSLQVTAGIKMGDLRIIGSSRTIMDMISIDSYLPIQQRYTVDISYKVYDVTIRFKHWCDHPVVVGEEEFYREVLGDFGGRAITIEYYKEF